MAGKQGVLAFLFEETVWFLLFLKPGKGPFTWFLNQRGRQ